MKFGLAPVVAAAAILPIGVRAQNDAAPPPPPPPALLMSPAEAAHFERPGTLLRFQFQPGDARTYKVTTDTTSRIIAADGHVAQPNRQHVETVLRETVQDVALPEGTATIILQPQDVRIVANGQVMPLSPEQRSAYLQERAIRVSPSGEITPAASVSVQQQSAMNPIIYGFLDTQGVFPPQSLRIGEHWMGCSHLRDLNAAVSNVYTISSVDDSGGESLVHISSVLSGPTAPAGAPEPKDRGQISGSGEIVFNSTHGALARSSVTYRARLPLTQIRMEQNGLKITPESDKQRLMIDRSMTIVRLDNQAAPSQPSQQIGVGADAASAAQTQAAP